MFGEIASDSGGGGGGVVDKFSSSVIEFIKQTPFSNLFATKNLIERFRSTLFD